MLPPGSLMLLLSILLLGAGSLSADVHSAPVEKDDRVEVMVTRCIVQVLLNVLSKADAPPINPLCKEFLKQSNRQKEEEQVEARDLEPNTMEKPQEYPVKEEQGPNEEEFKRQAEAGEKWHPEEKQHGGNDNAEGDSYSFDEAHEGEIEEEEDKRTEEDGSYKRNFPSEGESQTKKHTEELEHELQDKNILPPPGKVTEDDYKRSGGQREEIVHSQERENEDSKEEEDAEEEEEESREKYHHSFHREYEDSSEREDVDTDKRGHKPRYYYRKPKLGNSSEYKRRHHDEKKDSPEESSEEEHELWDKRGHYPKHYYETRHYSEEKRNSVEMHGSEEMGGKSRNKEHPDRWQASREDSEEENMGHHSWGNEEKQRDLERKRLREELQKELRHHYEERTPHSKPSEEDVAKEHSRDEKRHQHDKERLQLQLEELPKLQNMEKEEDREQRFHIPEEGEKEEKQHQPSVLEEELEERHHNERGKHVANKRTLLLEEGYPRSHYLVENVKRAVAPYIPYYQQFRWKNRHAEKKADIENPFLESEEEEPRSQMNERDFFPEYNDYDLWEKKQLMDDLGHKHSENNNLERSHKFDVKRQYNKMDQLAHLLSNRKKSVEFPELYSSREDMKRGHIIRSGEGKLRQRPLTQEEEKELENLAAMDLELQKIAEKFNSNRRG